MSRTGKDKHVNKLPVMNACSSVYTCTRSSVLYIIIHAYVHVHVVASVYMLICDKDQLVNM